MTVLDAIDFPPMIRVRQQFDPKRLVDIRGTIAQQIRALAPELPIKAGQRVALACPSRGLADYPVIVKSVADTLKALGLKPFIVPAMGSHGSATAEGQKHVLENLWITEAAVGAPIRSQMEVVPIGAIHDRVPVNIDRLAFEADHIVQTEAGDRNCRSGHGGRSSRHRDANLR